MSWITGKHNVRLTHNGVKVNKFHSEKDCEERIRQGGVVPMAFAYPNGSHWFALWEGTHLEMATWLYENHETIVDQHCTMLENTRGCSLKLGFDIDQPHTGPEPLAEAEKVLVAKITEIVKTNIYKKLFGSVKSSKHAIRFFSASRLQEDGSSKLSLHVNCRGVAFPSTAEAKRFVEYILPKFEGMNVDMTYYDTARKVRLPYMRKSAKVRTVFKPVINQVEDNVPSDLMLTAVSEQDTIFTLEKIGELIPDFAKWDSANVKAAPAPTSLGRVTSRNVLAESGRAALNAYFRIPETTTYAITVKDDGRAYLRPQGSMVCTLNHEHQHDGRSGDVVIVLENLDYYRKCFGSTCGASRIVFSNDEASMKLRMSLLMAVDCGEPLSSNDPIAKLLPDGRWRIVRCKDTQIYLQSQERIVAMFRKGVTTYDRTTGFQIADACPDKKLLLVTAHKDRLVDLLERDGMDLTFTMAEAIRLDSKDNQNAYSVAFQRYLVELLRVRGIRATKDGQSLYQLKEGSDFLYERISKVKDTHTLVEWLREDVFAHAPAPYRYIVEKWSSFTNFDVQFRLNIGSRVKMIEPTFCFGFRNGVLFFPTNICPEKKSMRSWFKKREELVTSGEAALPLYVFDVDFDERWADDLSFANGMSRALEFQGFRQEIKDLYMGLVLGRAIMQKCLRLNSCFDSWHINPITSGAPGTFKSEVVRAAQDVFGSRCADLAKPRGSDLACIEHITDEHTDLLIISDARLSAKRLFADEFDLVAWRSHADCRPIPVSKMRNKTDGGAIVSSGLIITLNQTTNPWGHHTPETTEKTSTVRRGPHFVFGKQPDRMDSTIEEEARTDLQRAALLVYAMQRYLDMRLEEEEPWTADRIMAIPEIAKWNTEAALNYMPLARWIDDCDKGEAQKRDLHGPFLEKKAGSYVTMGMVTRGYRDYMTRRHRRAFTGGCEPRDVHAAIALMRLDVKYAAGKVSKEGRVVYCGKCFQDESLFNQRGIECSHHGLEGVHSKEVKDGSLLGYALVDPQSQQSQEKDPYWIDPYRQS